MTSKIELSLVSIHNGQPFTSTIEIANGVNLQHKNVIALVKKFQTDFEEFGPCAFETRKSKDNSAFQTRNSKGRDTEYVELNEDQATYLITLFRNTDIVRAFKIKLVKAFRAALKEIDRLNKQHTEPTWKLVRDETKLGYKWMASALKDQREEQGKSTSPCHYSNEARLINAIITNHFTGLDRDNLDKSMLTLIANLQLENTKLLSKGIDYKRRQTILQDLFKQKLEATPQNKQLPTSGVIENGKLIVPIKFSIDDLRYLMRENGL